MLSRDEFADAILETQQPEICRPEHLKAESRHLSIPPDLYEGQGLISEGMEAIKDLSAINIVQYNFPTVISHISAALAGRIRCGHVHPSCFFIKVGGTSTGKTDADKYVKSTFYPYFNQMINKKDGTPPEVRNTLYGPTDFASGPGLLHAVQRQPTCLMVLDEISFMFMKHATAYDPNAQSKIKAILELSTNAGVRFERPYSDMAKTIVIEYPVVNIIGNATPGIFKTFSLDDLQSGLIQRFDFFCYDGQAQKKNGVMPNTSSKAVFKFAESLSAIHTAPKPDARFDLLVDSAVDIGMTKDVEKVLSKYSDDIIDQVNAEEDEGIKGIISRAYHAAIKFAIIRAGATRTPDKLFEPLEVDDIKYGIKLATILMRWKIDVLAPNIHAGDFDQFCRLFLEGAKSAVANGKRPTGRNIIHRRPKLKNLPPRIWDDVVKVLKARGQIRVIEENKTVYEPLVEQD